MRVRTHNSLIFNRVSVTLTEGEPAKVALEGCKDEYKDYLVYSELAKIPTKARTTSSTKFFQNLQIPRSSTIDFWKKYSPKKEPSTSRWGARLIIFMSLLFGTTFAIKFLEKHETKTIEKYKSVAHLIPEEDKSFFEGMIGK